MCDCKVEPCLFFSYTFFYNFFCFLLFSYPCAYYLDSLLYRQILTKVNFFGILNIRRIKI